MFLGEDSLFLYKQSGHVFGFEKEAAALLLQIDEKLSQGIKKERLPDLFPDVPVNDIDTLVDILLSRNVSADDEDYEQPLDTGFFTKDTKTRITYSVSPLPLNFSVHYPDRSLYTLIHPIFSHFSTSYFPERTINVDFEDTSEGLWQILFNGKKVAYPVKAETLPLVLQENMIIASYQSTPYLIALHAGTVGKKGRCVVMPAQSGSGKSTLTAALADAGFSLYSDEITRLDYDGKIVPLPFCMNIKEGSWSVLENRYASLRHSAEYLRFDGQKVKMIPPKNPAKEEGEAAILLFPKYIEGNTTVIKKLSQCEALHRIKEAGYQLEKPLTSETFHAVLKKVINRPAYLMEYGSLDEAVAKVDALLDG
ncbi:hypothetical protein [Hydrogenimonas sp. SS33]|uniref:hypothetical protein n=1 Tax=Hydrogenimonas leucolamina TaxID=2954236 RepID=UPI00336BECB9